MIEYKRKYSRYYKNYNDVLKDLYLNSINKLPNGSGFSAFNQVALKNYVNIKKYVVGIQITISKSISKTELNNVNHIIKYAKKAYPNIKIKIRHYEDLDINKQKN